MFSFDTFGVHDGPRAAFRHLRVDDGVGDVPAYAAVPSGAQLDVSLITAKCAGIIGFGMASTGHATRKAVHCGEARWYAWYEDR